MQANTLLEKVKTSGPRHTSEYYTGGGYLQTHPHWHAEDAAWKASKIRALVRDAQLDPGTVLEIGCGTGEIINQLSSAMPRAQFVGVDISSQALELAKPKSHERLRFELFDMHDPAFGPGRYDLVLVVDVFEHIEDYLGFLRTIRPAGTDFIFHIPLDLSVNTVFRSQPLLRKRKRAGHLHYFTCSTALETLRDSGYEVKQWRYTGSYTERPRRTFKSGLLNVFRKMFFRLFPDFTVRLLGGYSLLVHARPR